MNATTLDAWPTALARHAWLPILAAAHFPLLVVHYVRLWDREHYQFFPFALVACAALAAARLDRAQGLRWSWDARLLVVADLLLLAVGSWTNSPWSVALGFCLLVAATLRAAHDREFDQSLVGLAVLPLLTLNLPLGYDYQVILWLQSATTRVAGRLLLDLGYLHVRQGNVLHFPDRTFLVEEACSGVQSLFTLLFLAALLASWQRRKIVHLAVLGLCAVGLAGLMNVLRVVAVAVAWESWNVDVSTGWRHDLLGYLALAAAAIMLASANSLLAFLTDPLPAAPRMPPPILAKATLFNRLFSPTLRAATESFASTSPRGGLRWLAGVTALVGVLAVAAQAHAIWTELRRSPPQVAGVGLAQFPQTLLPEELVGYRQQSYEEVTRGQDDSLGHYSNTWTYLGEAGPALVSCDHPFRGWHDLTLCYRNTGWDIERSERGANDGWDYLLVRLFHPLEMKHGTLAFSLFDEQGRPMSPPPADAWRAKLQGMFAGASPDDEHRIAYQSQIFAESPTALRSEAVQRLVAAHLAARARMQAALLKSAP
jgi:exosortase